MRVKIYGGPLSISYNLAKFLKISGVDATLYVDRSPLDASYHPVWEDSDLNYAGTSWIKEVDLSLGGSIIRKKKEKKFLAELNDADILHMYGESSIWASFTKTPYIYNSYGYDLETMPFAKGSFKSRILSFFLKRSVSKSKCAIVSPKQNDVLKKLKLHVRTEYIPCPIDTEKYVKCNTSLRSDLLKKGNYDYIFFSPSRHEWTHTQASSKGNDRLINAFARFAKFNSKKALLVLIDKGRDTDNTKRLIKERGIEDFILWIKPQHKKDLIEFYSASDIVFDQFVLGEFGQIFLEAMSCGVPTFIYLKGYNGIYEENPPCINVSDEYEIYEKLIELTEDPVKLREIGAQSRQWIKKYHDWRISVRLYKNLYESILRQNG